MSHEVTRVAVAGDWHGSTNWATGRLMSLGATQPDIKVLLHLGDFGIWSGRSGHEYLDAIEKTAKRVGIEQIIVTPGNHDDYGRLRAMWDDDPANRGASGLELPLHLNEVVTVLPRGHRFELGGRSFVSLGGAPSVDFEMRTEGTSWWREEAITTDDVERTVSGGYADVMLAHDSPERPWMTPRVEHICHGEPDPDDVTFSWSDAALAYAAVGRDKMTAAFLGVQPRLFIHGHYHVRSSADVTLPNGQPCRIESLANDGKAENLVLLDLETLAVEAVRAGRDKGRCGG